MNYQPIANCIYITKFAKCTHPDREGFFRKPCIVGDGFAGSCLKQVSREKPMPNCKPPAPTRNYVSAATRSNFLKSLRAGRTVRHKNGDGYIIAGNYGSYAVGVKTMHITNPQEWEVVE